MRLAIWIVFGLACAAWTGVLGLFAWAAKAGIGLLDRVGSQGLGDLVSQWSLPAWMVSTFDLGWLQSVQVMLLQLLEWFGSLWVTADLLTGVMIATWLVWGSTYLAIKWALVSFPPFFQMGTRFVAAGLLLGAWARWRGARSPWDGATRAPGGWRCCRASRRPARCWRRVSTTCVKAPRPRWPRPRAAAALPPWRRRPHPRRW